MLLSASLLCTQVEEQELLQNMDPALLDPALSALLGGGKVAETKI